MPALRSALSLALECGNGRQGEKDDAAGNKIPTQASVELGDAIGSNSKFGTKLRTMLDEMGELASVLEDDTVAGSVSGGKGTTFQDRFKRFINIGSDGMVSKLVRARDKLLQRRTGSIFSSSGKANNNDDGVDLGVVLTHVKGVGTASVYIANGKNAAIKPLTELEEGTRVQILTVHN